MNLKETISAIALKWGYRTQEIREDAFNIEISLVRNKTDTRYQVVTVQRESFEGKPPRIYIQGYCGLYTDRIPLREVLKIAIGYNYCTVALLDGKDSNGNPMTELIIQACPQEEFVNTDQLDAIIFEVADKTDYLVMKYFDTVSAERP